MYKLVHVLDFLCINLVTVFVLSFKLRIFWQQDPTFLLNINFKFLFYDFTNLEIMIWYILYSVPLLDSNRSYFCLFLSFHNRYKLTVSYDYTCGIIG